MSEKLHVAESTVKHQLKTIRGKLGVYRAVDAAQQAERLGLLIRGSDLRRSHPRAP